MFTELFNVMQDKQVLNLNLLRTDDKLVVSFQPLASNDTAATGGNLSPLVVTATPAELDAGFIQAITAPLQERYAMIVNLEEFKQSTKSAAPKAKTDQKTGTGNVSVIDATAKKSKKDGMIEEAEKLVKAKNHPAAYAIYKKLYEQDKTDEKVGTRMHEIWALMSQRPLFEQEPETTTVIEEEQSDVSAVADKKPAVPVAQTDVTITTKEKEEEPVPDMFAQIINRANNAGVGTIDTTEEEKAKVEQPSVMLPPGMTIEDYKRFLAFQQFQRKEEAASIV